MKVKVFLTEISVALEPCNQTDYTFDLSSLNAASILSVIIDIGDSLKTTWLLTESTKTLIKYRIFNTHPTTMYNGGAYPAITVIYK